MSRGIYSIKISSLDKEIDLDLPQNIKINLLTDSIINSLKNSGTLNNNSNSYRLYSKKLNSYLDDDETLYSLGLWEGSILELQN